jgi:hypothetical protein
MRSDLSQSKNRSAAGTTANYIQLDLFPAELVVRKVGANSHIGFDGAYYSVPHTLFGEKVIVRAKKHTIDILDCNGSCVASHNRSYIKRKYTTVPSHMSNIYYSIIYDDRYDGAKLRKWAESIGDKTYQVIDLLLDRKKIEEHAYKSCMAILRLAGKYGKPLLEKACTHALDSGTCNFTAIQKFVKNEYDKRINS